MWIPMKKLIKCSARVSAVREAVGPYVGIGIDFHGRVHKPMAKILAKELEVSDRCSLKSLYYRKIMNHCVKSPIIQRSRLRQVKECSPSGISKSY